jgi:isoamylase
VPAGGTLHLQSRSVVVLREHTEPEIEPDSSVAASLANQAGA